MNGQDWGQDGVIHLPGFLAGNPVLDAYIRVRQGKPPGGYPSPTPYMQVPELRAILCNRKLSSEIRQAVGETAGLHLALTGWVSTERNWHSDWHLNPAHVGGAYCGVWIALEDIHPASGPFQYVPGSHRWPVITQKKVLEHMPKGSIHRNDWPKLAEEFLVPAIERQMAARNSDIVTYVPRKGDVLIWHPNLIHRGSAPIDPGRERRALIAHYSGLSRRPDMGIPVNDHINGGWFWEL